MWCCLLLYRSPWLKRDEDTGCKTIMLQTLVNASVSQFSLVCSTLTSEGINLTLADIQKCSIALLLNPSGAQSFAQIHSASSSAFLATCCVLAFLWKILIFFFFPLMYINLWLSMLENSAGHFSTCQDQKSPIIVAQTKRASSSITRATVTQRFLFTASHLFSPGSPWYCISVLVVAMGWTRGKGHWFLPSSPCLVPWIQLHTSNPSCFCG